MNMLGLFRRVLAVFIFGVAVRVVHADADDLFRRWDRRLPMIASSAWSGERFAASSASFVSAPAAMASRKVGYSFPKRAERSTMPASGHGTVFCGAADRVSR